MPCYQKTCDVRACAHVTLVPRQHCHRVRTVDRRHLAPYLATQFRDPRGGRGSYLSHSREVSARAVGIATMPRESQASDGEEAVACGTLVVGGGPTGYGVASMLAQQGHSDIVILERNESADWYDASKAYAYNIDFRGRDFLTSIGITDLDDIGLSASGMVITYVELDGSTREQTAFSFNKPNKEEKIKPGGVWISRHGFVQHLQRHTLAAHGDAVRVQFGSVVRTILLPKDDSNQIELEVSVKGRGTQRWRPKLLIAADGMNSVVREALRASSAAGAFEVQKTPSDAAGLSFKILTLTANPKLLGAQERQFMNDKAVVVPGKDLGDGTPLRMGLLPNKNLSEPRSANFIQWPDHKIWTITDANELFSYLEQSFPQIDIRGVVTRQEAERFVSRRPGVFPEPQYCPTMFKSFATCESPDVDPSDPLSSMPGCAVVLLGDALHAFPPDLGQGVNSALQDVEVLRECLQRHPRDYHRALKDFQDERLPDVKALMKLMQVGAPYQYRQPKKALNQSLWTANFMLRVGLNRLLPGVFYKPAFANLSSSARYSEVLEASTTTTRRLVYSIVGLLAVGLASVKMLGWI